MVEIWKDIKGYERLYQVSNLGNVKSFRKGKITILKGMHNFRGYHLVALYKNRQAKWFQVHRLVAQTFLENIDNLPQVNHKDEVKTNNSVDNLEWCTNKYNEDYGTRVERRIQKIKKPVIGVNIYSGFILCLDSAKEGSNYNFNRTLITRCCKGDYNHHKNFKWFYDIKEELNNAKLI